MTAEELILLLQKRPFRPLRLRLVDGRSREIRNSKMTLVSESLIAIGVPPDDDSRVAKRMTYCSVQNIVEVERFDIAAENDADEMPF